MWHQLSNATDFPGVERRLARTQEMWEAEYNKFIAEPSTFVNKEINDFQCSVGIMGDSVRELSIHNTHLCEFAQATS